MNEIPKIDPELRKAISREAKDLLNDRVFNLAMRALHNQYYGQLMVEGLSKSKRLELVARLAALEAIPKRIESMSLDEEMAQRGSRR